MVIDHDLGGGANLYRERMLEALLKRGESVLVLTFFMPTLQFVLEYRNSFRTERFALSSLSEIISIVECGLIRDIFYNNAVSFHDPRQIPELLVHLKNSNGIPFRLAMHDYFSICPSHFLLNSEGRYCNLPSAQECNRCLSKNMEGFVRVAGVTDIGEWRASWGRCLDAAEEIIFFSEASRTILRKAYPELPQHNMVVRPHTVEYMPPSIPRINNNAPLHIGLLGNITKAKGAEVLRDLSEEILHRGTEIPITVIGTVDAEYQIPSVRETGHYTTDRLAHLIELSGANLFLFPSILPETFSYVIAELIALDVPVICFDFGAPAERISKYHLGQVIPFSNPSILLDELLSFHARLSSLQIPSAGERV
jgi:glycosyltransferase involved in cell wall biosynthesis